MTHQIQGIPVIVTLNYLIGFQQITIYYTLAPLFRAGL